MSGYLITEQELQAKHRVRSPVSAMPTLDVRPRVGPWSNNNELGYWIKPRVADNFRQPLLKLDEWGQPSVRTISLSVNGDISTVSAPALVPGIVQNGARAEITVGAGGTTQTFQVDLEPYCSISLPFNSCKVDIVYGSAAVVGTELEATISAMVGEGTLGRSYSTLTQYIQIVNGVNTIAIPPGARAFRVEGPVSAPMAGVQVQAGLTAFPMTVFDYMGGTIQWIPLAGYRNTLDLSYGGVGLIPTAIIFQMGF